MLCSKRTKVEANDVPDTRNYELLRYSLSTLVISLSNFLSFLFHWLFAILHRERRADKAILSLVTRSFRLGEQLSNISRMKSIEFRPYH